LFSSASSPSPSPSSSPGRTFTSLTSCPCCHGAGGCSSIMSAQFGAITHIHSHQELVHLPAPSVLSLTNQKRPQSVSQSEPQALGSHTVFLDSDWLRLGHTWVIVLADTCHNDLPPNRSNRWVGCAVNSFLTYYKQTIHNIR